MKTSLLILMLGLTACSKQAVYSAVHERERQKCIEQGRYDCPSYQSYREYKDKRDEALDKK